MELRWRSRSVWLVVSAATALVVLGLTILALQPAAAAGSGKSEPNLGIPDLNAAKSIDQSNLGQRLSWPTQDVVQLGEPSPRVPLMFIENVGQFGEGARFKLWGAENSVYLADDAVWITILDPSYIRGHRCPDGWPGRRAEACRDYDEALLEARTTQEEVRPGEVEEPPDHVGVHLKLSFEGANPSPRIVGLDPIDNTISYFVGSGPEDWYSDVPVYAGVRYEEVYPGIDVEYGGPAGQWQPRIVAKPWADLSSVQLRIEGAETVNLSPDGQLELETAIGWIELPLFQTNRGEDSGQSRPVIRGQSVSSPYEGPDGPDSDSILVGGLIYSTFVGGSGNDQGIDVAVDEVGAVHVAGNTYSSDFPTTPGAFEPEYEGTIDIVVFKLSPDGSRLIYSTYLGRSLSQHFTGEYGLAIAIDSTGAAYIAGRTDSDHFPVTEGAFQETFGGIMDGFISRLSPDGTQLIYSTYLGGTDWDSVNAIDLDSSNNVFVTGATGSTDFPISQNAYQEELSGEDDAFVTKVNADGNALIYSTYLGGSLSENDLGSGGIVVDQYGNTYVSGYTESTDFPTTTLAYQGTYVGWGDAFVTKLNPDGSSLLYSTYLGGTDTENGWGGGGLAVDLDGEIYVLGMTESDDFPTTQGAFQETFGGGGRDLYLTKLNASGTDLVFSTYLGGNGWDIIQTTGVLALDDKGRAYITGMTESSDFPTTLGAFQEADPPSWDAFVTIFNADGSGLVYSTYLGGSGSDNDQIDGAIAVNRTGVYVIGGTFSLDFPITPGAFQSSQAGRPDIFVAKLFPGLPLFEGMDWNVECPFCSVADTQQIRHGVNTRTGNFGYMDTALGVPALGGELAFRYGYLSAATGVYTTTMGRGWTHNFDMQLHFTTTVATHTIILQAPGGSRFPYYGNGDGTYTKYPGVTAELLRVDGPNPSDTEYVVTSFNQYRFTFNAEGRLIEQKDPFGNVITLTYDNQTELLYRASQGGRYLQYGFDPVTQRLETVTDNAGRTVTLAYSGDDLESVTNAADETTVYSYNGAANLLTGITDASGRTIRTITYDLERRAYRVKDGNGRTLVEVDFGGGQFSPSSGDLSATNVVTASGVVMTHTYGARGTLISAAFACVDEVAGCRAGGFTGYDYNFKASRTVDENGHTAGFLWDPGGSNLELAADSLGNETGMSYDAFNNLTQVVNARSFPTTYTYSEDPDLPTFRTSMTDALSHTTVYTPTQDGRGLLFEEKDPNDVVTHYEYNGFGQVTQVVRGFETPDAVTTTYDYDPVGRLITTTQFSAADTITSLNVYDPADRLTATIENWNGDASILADIWACFALPAGRDYNICTAYKYDGAGRTISTTNTLTQTSLTFYDDAGRVVTSVVNYDGDTVFVDLCTSFADPDQESEFNICSLTDYDQFGRMVATTDSLGHVTRTEYNAVGRVAGTIQNSVNVSVLASCTFTIAPRDQDLCTLYEYDPAGNTLVFTDPAGRKTRTLYDPLNRVLGTVQNWTGTIDTLAELESCLTPSTAYPPERDVDICTGYEYDEVGNTIIVTDTLGRVTRTYYDPLNRVEATVQNFVPGEEPFLFDGPEDCDIQPGNTITENICTLYGYDPAGNQITVTNALSQTSLTVYDRANRPAVQVANWDRETEITPDGAGCADTQTNPTALQNLCTITEYDELGRRAVVTDTLGNPTEFTYDGLGRVVTTTHYLDAEPVYSRVDYDALGNRLSQTDAEDHTTTYAYDDLNRLELTTSAEGVTITQAYNAASWVLTTTDGLGHTTTNDYDALGRVLTVTNALDHSTLYVYDALGNQKAQIDAEGVRTSYLYDDLNRLVSVVENDIGSEPTNDSNLRTEYEYDALGNRTVITNAIGIEEEFPFTLTAYDDLNRPITVTDALTHETIYAYDALGNRLAMTDGNEEVTEYAYDDLNRLEQVSYLADGRTVSYGYDAAGNRTAMTDTLAALGVTTYVYDDLYRLTDVTDAFEAHVGYGYDKAGNRTTLTYPDGRVVTSTYNLDNQLWTVEDWDHAFTKYGYDDAGRLITSTLPNGVQTTYGYDDANRLTSLVHESEGDELLASFHYELDKVGNRKVATETLLAPLPESLAALPGGLPADQVAMEVTGQALEGSGAGKPHLAVAPEEARPVAAHQPAGRLAEVTLSGPASLGPQASLPDAQRPPGPPVAELTVRLERATLTADGRDGAQLVILATDAQGRPVADGTAITLQAAGGQLAPPLVTTSGGLAYAWLQAGAEPGAGQVQAQAGQASAIATFDLLPPPANSVREDNLTAPPEGPLPFDLQEVVEQARHTIQAPPGAPPFVEALRHRAQFAGDGVEFVPHGVLTATVPATVTVALAEISVGGVPLPIHPVPPGLLLHGNLARLPRGTFLNEEWVARDAGVEQRWRLETDPGLAGDLVVAVEVQTALTVTLAEGGAGFEFRAVDPATGAMTPVVGYGRALGVDAAGRPLRAALSYAELEPTIPGWHRYRLAMAFPAAWLAEASYPLVIDPLLGSLLRLDAADTQSGQQSKPAVAYNSTDDEYLVVWQDVSDGGGGEQVTIHGQRVAADGLLVEENFAIYTGGVATLPDVAYNPDDNNYLVVWRDGGQAIKGRTVTATGGLGNPVTFNALTSRTRTNPAVAYSPAAARWLVIWQEWNGRYYDVIARAWDGSGTPGTLFTVYSDGSRKDATLPDVAANGGGQFLVVWEQAVSELYGAADVYARRVTTTTVSGNSFAVMTSPTSQVAPAVTYDPDDDEYLVAWQDLKEGPVGNGHDEIWARQVKGVPNGGEFVGNPFQVSGTALADSAAPAASYFAPGSSGEGTYLVAWTQTITGGALDLQAQRVLTDATFTGPILDLSSAAGDQTDAALAFGPAVTATLAAWTDGRAGNLDVYTRRVAQDGALANEYMAHPAAGDQQNPQVAYNPDDDEYLVVWQDYRNGTANPDIYGQRVSGDGLLVGGNITVTTTADKETNPQIAYGSGVYLVAWRHFAGADTGDAYGRIVSPTGQLVGSSPLIISSGTYVQQVTDIIHNSDLGQFLVLWKDLRTGWWNVWGRHVAVDRQMRDPVQITFINNKHEVNAAGAYNPDDQQYLIVWEYEPSSPTDRDLIGRRIVISETVVTTESIRVDMASVIDQREPDVIYLSGPGRYAVLWREGNSTNGYDIIGRLVSPAGVVDGNAYTISAESEDERTPRLAEDGSGGALVVWWRDNGASGGLDLYGRRLDADGDPLSSAFPILATAYNQDQHAVVGRGAGRFFLAWRDNRNGNDDIYGSPFQSLQAAFTAAPTSGPAPLQVQFSGSDTPAGAADAWLWEFGDGGGSLLQSPVYTYTTAGAYTVTLTITDTDTGETDTLAHSSFITVTEPGGGGPVTIITYAYDRLYRLTGASYTGVVSAKLEYAYDAVGNRMAFTRTITATEVTTYTYNAANQLETAKLNTSPDKWYYEFDGNGNQTRQVPNGLTPAEGEVRYTYDQRNLLVRVEHRDGVNYHVQTEAVYDGLGQRLQAIAFLEGTPVTTTFTLDAGRAAAPLVVSDGSATTFLLYGLFGVGEYAGAWQYYLGDGQFSVRQLTDAGGALTLARTYAPFGNLLQLEGSGSSLYGFAGTVSGGGGLLYRDGRYFDPATGRFLSRDDNFDATRPGTLNGYLGAWFLANPGGLLFGPLLVFNWRRRRRKRSRVELGLMIVVGLGLGITLVGCEEDMLEETTTPVPGEVDQGAPPTAPAPSPTGTGTPAPSPTSTSTTTPTSTATATATCTPTPYATAGATATSTAVPREHWGINRTPVRGFELSEDDLFLLTLGVFAENNNASHEAWAMTLWTWTFLNKLAYRLGSDLYTMLNSRSTSGAWNDSYFVNAHTPFRGPVPADPREHREWLLEIARGDESVESDGGYMGRSSQRAQDFQALHKLIVGNNVQAIDGGIYDDWRIFGTNSTADPTHGAIYAVHRPPQRFDELGPLFARHAENDPNFSYVFSLPYRFEPYSTSNLMTMTVVGNHECVYDHSLCN